MLHVIASLNKAEAIEQMKQLIEQDLERGNLLKESAAISKPSNKFVIFAGQTFGAYQKTEALKGEECSSAGSSKFSEAIAVQVLGEMSTDRYKK